MHISVFPHLRGAISTSEIRNPGVGIHCRLGVLLEAALEALRPPFPLLVPLGDVELLAGPSMLRRRALAIV